MKLHALKVNIIILGFEVPTLNIRATNLVDVEDLFNANLARVTKVNEQMFGSFEDDEQKILQFIEEVN